MAGPISNLAILLKSLKPFLHDGVVAFCAVDAGHDVEPLNIIATFLEAEGLTIVVDERVAIAHQLTPVFRAAWITLTVHSDLNAVGLTAAVATALANEGISCNVIAAVHHDHLFVPVERVDDAMRVLRSLSDHSGVMV